MKRTFTFLLGLTISFFSVAQSSYSGNAGSGFGSAIGGSTLSISEDASTIYFTLNKGAGAFNDAFVLYLDVFAGGENNTAAYTDAGDPSRTAISGLSYETSPGNGIRNRSVINFPSGFGADYAIAVSPANNFAGLYILNTTASHTLGENAGLVPGGNTMSSTYTFRIEKLSIGINGAAAFKFLGTYLNSGTSTYRSNEGYGNLTFSATADASGNPGYNTTTATSFFNYPIQVLPVKLLSFTGSVVDAKGKLNWQVANDNEVNKYVIEKSINGKDFTAIETIAAHRTSAAQSYTAEDAKLSGTNYYRLKTTDLQNIVNYSKIVQLSVGVKGQGFTIFPNPVMQTLNMKMAKLEKGQYDVNVYNAAGQMVFAKAIQYDGSGNTLQVTLPANMQRGNYNCILSNTAGKFVSSFLKQ